MIELTGITWNHERGYGPMVATAEAFQRLHPDVRITWQKRSLKAFGDFPVERLADSYDLLVIDHPFVGTAATTGCLAPLDEFIGADYLGAQAENAIGWSHASYRYDGHQWALAIDAAAQVSTYRADLMATVGEEVPQTWTAFRSLAERCLQDETSRVAIPLCPTDSLMSFFSLCKIHDCELFEADHSVVDRDVGAFALGLLRGLVPLLHEQSLTSNPIQIFDLMSATDEILYCPLAFGYSNYGRAGYRNHLLSFADIPRQYANAPAAGAILGGTGFAVSSRCAHIDIACEYGKFVASPDVQSGLYFDSGGQPGHRSGWEDAHTNSKSNRFFRNTLETLDNAFLRPRYHGFAVFQEHAFHLTHDCLKGELGITDCLDRMDALYRKSLEM